MNTTYSPYLGGSPSSPSESWWMDESADDHGKWCHCDESEAPPFVEFDEDGTVWCLNCYGVAGVERKAA